MRSRLLFGSVRSRLVLLFFVITAAAIGFVYLYVVPQLNSSLTAEKLRRLEADAREPGRALEAILLDGQSQREVRRAVGRISQRVSAPVTLLGVRRGEQGPRAAFVVADSEVERSALVPAYPSAATAIETGAPTTAVERVGDGRVGQTAVPLPADSPDWVMVLSAPLGEVDDNVALIRRQIVIAGAIALAAALAAGSLAAGAHSRRLLRLEHAAELVADGDFSTPIPVDSGDEVGQLASTLDEMRARLERLDSARKEFIANASHELRTPIFSLGGFVELLDEEDPDPEARAEFVATMREQIARLTKLTADLLDLSKLDADAMSVGTEAVPLGQVARGVAAEFAPRAEAHGSRIVLELEDGALASADPDRVVQILRILIDNALGHTPGGTEITVTTKTAQGKATLSVRDNGPGIDARDREQVFERFFTGDETSGSGLGLAIARELARLMGGDISLNPRRGANEFALTLPASARIESRA